MVMIDIHKLLHWCLGHREAIAIALYCACFITAYRNARTYQLEHNTSYDWESIFGNLVAGILSPFYLFVVVVIRLSKWWDKKNFSIKAPRWL